MGAGQSSEEAAGAGQEVKSSYYELLGVERQATEDEIKRAYRRKALELHPDRNYGNEQAATSTFAEVQTAYEILSDPQERAWYDSHESAILRGDDGQGEDNVPSYQNIRITTADDLARLVRKFNSNVEFTDSPSGFFGFVRETFEQLAKEEDAAANWDGGELYDYPTFGHKDDKYDDVVKRFYSAWSNFATIKSFAWKDKWKLSEAPDRWYRRQMEKENKALRQEGVKEFNEAVRSFVAFVRKRDPRYVPSTQSEEERQKVLRDAAASQAARARAANQAKMSSKVPEWTKVQEPEEDVGDFEEEEEEQEVFECVACNKTFKSENSWEAHERSKKHQKAIYALQKKMRKDDAHLDLGDGNVSSGVTTPDTLYEEKEVLDDVAAEVEDHEARKDVQDAANGRDDMAEDLTENEDEDDEPGSKPAGALQAQQDSQIGTTEPEEGSDTSDSDYASAATIQARLQPMTLDTPASTLSEADDDAEEYLKAPGDLDSQFGVLKRPGKAAQKRARKAAAAIAETSEEAGSAHRCATCQAEFPSKTRLHQHIKDFKHAALKSVAAAGGGKGKKGKGKR